MAENNRKITIRVRTEEQLKAVTESAVPFEQVIVPIGPALKSADQLYKNGVHIFVQLPWATRQNKTDLIAADIIEALNLIEQHKLHGMVLTNLDEIGLVRQFLCETPYEIIPEILGDSYLYAYNSEALDFYRNFFPKMKFILSDELTDVETGEMLDGLKLKNKTESAEYKKQTENESQKNVFDDFLYKIYGYQQLMITNQCLMRNHKGCETQNRNKQMQFRDEKGNAFFSAPECRYCYSVIYNGVPTYMMDRVYEVPYNNLLVDFTLEDYSAAKKILRDTASVINGESVKPEGGYTRGHHYNGVE